MPLGLLFWRQWRRNCNYTFLVRIITQLPMSLEPNLRQPLFTFCMYHGLCSNRNKYLRTLKGIIYLCSIMASYYRARTYVYIYDYKPTNTTGYRLVFFFSYSKIYNTKNVD